MQCNITDHDCIIENLCILLSKAEDNLKEALSKCNFVDRKIKSLHTLFAKANDKLMKAVSEHNGFILDLEWHASHYKREHDDNNQKVKKLERKLDDKKSQIVEQHSRICTYQEHMVFLEHWNILM